MPRPCETDSCPRIAWRNGRCREHWQPNGEQTYSHAPPPPEDDWDRITDRMTDEELDALVAENRPTMPDRGVGDE